MNIINLTPHALNIRQNDGSFLKVPPSGKVVRVECKRAKVDEEQGISLYAPVYGDIEGAEGIEMKGEEEYLLITSAIAKIPLRDYLFEEVDGAYEDGPPPYYRVASPGELIRNDSGEVVGCNGLDL